MKKNLRIVSAAAAALLAVAPVAASAVSVNAADSTATTTANATNSNQDYSHINLNGNVTSTNNVTNVNPSFSLTGAAGNVAGNLTGSISATFNGTSATANLFNGQNGHANVKITSATDNSVIYDGTASTVVNNLNRLVAGQSYNVVVNSVGFNFGANNAGKEVTLAMPKNSPFSFTGTLPTGWTAATTTNGNVTAIKGKLDNNGTVNGLTISGKLTALDATNTNNVVFYNVATGQPATSGNVDVVANANGQLNVSALLPAVQSSYVAVQKVLGANNNTNGGRDDNPVVETYAIQASSDIADQLKAEGITVDANGNFNAKHSFTLKVKATSEGKATSNGKSAEMTVTFTTANVAEEVAPSVSKTIMHNAYYYDKDAKRVGTDKLTRYNSVTVSPKTTTISGKAYYEVVENGKLSGKFINADNIDGTKRTLKHNAYVYATSKKRANKVVLKKGEEVTTYGGTYTFKNGKQYYKIGNDTKKTYVKASNF